MKAIFLISVLLFGFASCSNRTQLADGNANRPSAQTPATSSATATASTVNIASPDGVNLVGSFFDSAKPNSPALLMLHQWQSDRHSFDDFAKQIGRASCRERV